MTRKQKLSEEDIKARSECLVLTADALAARFRFQALLMIGLDEGDRITLGGAGLDPRDTVRLLHETLIKLCRKHRIEVPREMVMPAGDDGRGYVFAGKCPVCTVNVLGPPQRPDEPETCAAVCECGSFLRPLYNERGELGGVAVLTLEEVAELPDHVRISLIRLRRDHRCTGREGGEER
jgi:hypothetical protein